LTGSGTLSGAGNAAGNGIYVIGAKWIDSTFAGTMQDGSQGNLGIVKTGADTLTLNGTVNYTGPTTVNTGKLALIEPVSLDNSPTINLSSNGVIDVSGRADGTLNLGNTKVQTLTGVGTVNGSLVEAANSFVRAGLGNLTVTNTATFNGNLSLQLNRTNAFTHSEILATGFTMAGPLTVTNVGPALQGGDSFVLFNHSVSGFTATNLPALSAGMIWTNKLSVNGTIAVVATVNTNPTNITAVVSGNLLQLSWPADHTGWTLQVETNALNTGIRTNWVDVPGSAAVNSTNITIDVTKPTVFYRLKF
ncbi:MAG: autotransporter-associated beta strand repeat-containing protein, partial [Verrucomicrobia bacterium]|nr:autotransporter-associated beta strand repeat-containing protein [Verrucomicrobiota bacterium]